MKKKLVAFAVTAAMVITSAVPVFAVNWTDKPTTPTTNPNPNVITLNAGENRATYAIAGPTADGAHFSQVIDLNKGPGYYKYYQYDLFFTDKENGTQKDQKMVQIKGEDPYADAYNVYVKCFLWREKPQTLMPAVSFENPLWLLLYVAA